MPRIPIMIVSCLLTVVILTTLTMLAPKSNKIIPSSNLSRRLLRHKDGQYVRDLKSGSTFVDEFPNRDITEDLAKLSLAIYDIEDGTEPQDVVPDGYVVKAYLDFSDPSPDTEALIVTSEARGDVIIVFRGTESSDDWKTNFDSKAVKGRFDNSPDSVLLHRGFQDAAFVSVDALEAQLRDAIGDIEDFSAGDIYVTGASLGGALSHIVGTHLADRFQGQKFKVVNFGAPRFGNKDFKTWSESKLQNLSVWRFCNRADFAPRIFRFSEYVQAGHLFQIWLRSSKAYYRQTGGGGYQGVPFSWYFGVSVPDHNIRAYIKFFEEKSKKSKYWPTKFE